MIVASAPGKLVLAGEYAVLHGAPAIVVAVQTRATVTLGGATRSELPPEVRATRELLEQRFGATEGELAIDVAALRAGDRKLGVGSSAAAAVAAAAACLHALGHDLDETTRATVLELALAGHRAVAPRGSGIDVAASTFGGTLHFERRDGAIVTRPLETPLGLEVAVVFTGTSARTSDLLDAVDAFAARAPRPHAEAIGRLSDAARTFAAAYERREVDGVIAAANAYHEAMRALGEAAGARVVEERLATLAALARAHGGAGKPSGAGGGDVAVAFFATPDRRRAFENACRDHGFTVLDVALAGPGVRIETTRADVGAVR